MKALDYMDSALFMLVCAIGAGLVIGILIALPVFSALGVCRGW